MTFSSSRLMLLLSGIAFALSLLAIAKEAVAQDTMAIYEPLREATITITGRASVNAEPDLAIVRAGAVTEARTAREAMDANTKIMSDAFAILDELGIDERDRQTSRLTVEPRYTYFDSSNGERRPPRIDGYSVSNQITVRVRDLASIGDVLDALITAGVNQMGGLSFTIDEPAIHFENARRLAVADAISQATVIADASGVGLGRIISITQAAPRQHPPEPMAARMALAEAATAVPVATGEQQLSATVTIVWALDNAGL